MAKEFVQECIRNDDFEGLRKGLGRYVSQSAIHNCILGFQERWPTLIKHAQETKQMNDTIPIPLPALNRLWKVRFADSIETPKTASTVLIRGAQTVMDAAMKAKKTLGWKAFQEKFPEAEVVGVEYAGEVEA